MSEAKTGMRCAVITPIGPGHAALYHSQCAPSIDRAIAYSTGPFEQVLALPMDDTQGQHGRSARRNTAVQQALEQGIDWVFFLDADDILAPNAFQVFAEILDQDPGLDAVWGLICEQDGPSGEPDLRPDQPERIDTRAQFLGTHPYLAVQIGAFLRTSVAAALPFDETLDTGEDYDLYRRLWRDARCVKCPAIFFVNIRGQHSTGPRAATGQDWSHAVTAQWVAELAQTPGTARIVLDGVESRMALTNPRDLIQAHHAEGRFFEADSLAALRRLLPGGQARSVLEIGANIGNHVVYYAAHLGAERILPVEPNPQALTLLEANIDLNGLQARIDRRGLGLGVGAAPAQMRAVTEDAANLGATRLVADPDGPIPVTTVDALLQGQAVDLIKIDAEGMELDVLAGAVQTFAESRPFLWIEVLRGNAVTFLQNWCRANGYRAVHSVTYVNTIDYFAAPREKGPTA